jgi:MarR family transcriptional regulator, lower aerobic nicotinate degradation pathway regulator
MDAPMEAAASSESRAPRRLWRLPSWLVSNTAVFAHRLVSERFAAEGYRKPHYTVLVALSEIGPASQAALGRSLSIDRSDMVAVLNELEHDGLVARVRDETDRRRNLVRLTPEGSRTLERLDEEVEAAQDELLAPLSAAERRELRRLLTRVVEHHAGR